MRIDGDGGSISPVNSAKEQENQGKIMEIEADKLSSVGIASSSNSKPMERLAIAVTKTPKTNGIIMKVPVAEDIAQTTEIPKRTEMESKAVGTQSWASVVTGNKMASRGMDLKFIAPSIKEGEKFV